MPRGRSITGFQLSIRDHPQQIRTLLQIIDGAGRVDRSGKLTESHLPFDHSLNVDGSWIIGGRKKRHAN